MTVPLERKIAFGIILTMVVPLSLSEFTSNCSNGWVSEEGVDLQRGRTFFTE